MSNEVQVAVVDKPVVYTPAVVRAVKSAVFPKGTDAEIELYFYKCQSVGCHPLTKAIIPIAFQNNDGTRTVSFITTIDLFRTKAEESGQFDGTDEPVWGETQVMTYKDEEIEYPVSCKILAYRKDRTRPSVGEVRWKEYYPGDAKGHKWRQMPFNMLGKCAEAMALRKAFPDKLDKLYASEEMDQAFDSVKAVPASTKPSVRPTTERVAGPAPAAAPAPAEGDAEDHRPRPTEEQVKALKLVNDKQAGLLIGRCKKHNLSEAALCAAVAATYGREVPSVYFITWDKSNKACMDAIVKMFDDEDKLNKIRAFEPEAPASEPAAQEEPPIPPEDRG